MFAALMRQSGVAAAEPEHDEHDQRDHEDPDDRRRDESTPSQICSIAGLLVRAAPGRLILTLRPYRCGRLGLSSSCSVARGSRRRGRA
jgi:hypothetical protein